MAEPSDQSDEILQLSSIESQYRISKFPDSIDTNSPPNEW